MAESGHPDDALKHYQIAQFAVDPKDSRHDYSPALADLLHGESALELAALEHESVREELAVLSHGLLNADSRHLIALTHIRMGNLDIAQSFAAGAVQLYEGSAKRRHAVPTDITLAMVYVLAGEPRGLQLSHKAISSVAEIRSIRARTRLRPLIAALESRPGSDYRDLVVAARRVSSQCKA